MAMKLHPDKHDGCEVKSGEFKQVTEKEKLLASKPENVPKSNAANCSNDSIVLSNVD